MRVYLPPGLLRNPASALLPTATGKLVWVRQQEQTSCALPAVHPALLIQTAARAGPRVEIRPHLRAPDPLLSHIALVLQTILEATTEAQWVYAEIQTTALAAHVLRWYIASQHDLLARTSGLTPYTLQRTTAYIQAHLEQALFLAELAAVAQMSRDHFARLFKRATGLTPHQYIIRCRVERAIQLMVDTAMPLLTIAHQLGFADQSHFSAAFHQHTGLTPTEYRRHTRGGIGGACARPFV